MRFFKYLLLFSTLVGSCIAGAANAAPKDARHEAGRRLYNFLCYYCHGYSGDARTLASTYVDPKPKDFTTTPLNKPTRPVMLLTVANGKEGTAMAAFKNRLNPKEIELVVDFIRKEFMQDKAVNTRYHTRENGWPNHERYRHAFPFATGEIALDAPMESLTPEQRRGKQLFLATCVSCHDRSHVNDEGVIWEARPVSIPRIGYSHANPPQVDAMASATPYSRHDIPLKIAGLTKQQAKGAELFLRDCAFCHAADGTGRNWIGAFMEPHARDLTGEAMTRMTRSRLKHVIEEGLPETSMPAWKSVLTEEEIEAVIAYISRAFHPVIDDSKQKKARN